MRVLGIDTSCDDTAFAVVDGDFAILANVVASQEEHAAFGGVVPELASRAHVRALAPILQAALERAGCSLGDLSGVAVTSGPGLLGSLLVGVSFAKSLALARGLPLVGVNHLEAHVWSALSVDRTLIAKPFLALVASGGHTELVWVQRFGSYEHLGGTRDDAAGEAFDKVAKLLGLGYPGGPAIERLAASASPEQAVVRFPVARLAPYEFSFSGLKTAVRNYVQEHPPATDAERAGIALGFQNAVVRALVEQLQAAVERYGAEDVVLCGGVACNNALAGAVEEMLGAKGVRLHRPGPKLCTDNGAMVGFVGLMHLRAGTRAPWTLGADPRADSLNGSPAATDQVDRTHASEFVRRDA